MALAGVFLRKVRALGGLGAYVPPVTYKATRATCAHAAPIRAAVKAAGYAPSTSERTAVKGYRSHSGDMSVRCTEGTYGGLHFSGDAVSGVRGPQTQTFVGGLCAARGLIKRGGVWLAPEDVAASEAAHAAAYGGQAPTPALFRLF